MLCYGRILSAYPALIVGAVGAISLTCLLVVFTTHSTPDFSDPQLGFECRGTKLALRATAWENLLRATRRTGPLTTNPLEASLSKLPSLFSSSKNAATLKKNRTRTRRPPDSQTPTATPSTILVGLGGSSWGSVRSNALEDSDDEIDSEKNSARKSASKSSNSHPLEKLRGFESSSKDMTATNHSHFEWGATVVTRAPGRKNNKHKPIWNQLQQLGATGLVTDEEKHQQILQPNESERFYFCDQPHVDYAHVVFAPTTKPASHNNQSQSLWNVGAIHSMCRLDEVLKSNDLFPSLCSQRTDQITTNSRSSENNTTNQCCPSWSLGHYIAQMTNRTSCAEIDEHDVETAFRVLALCAKHYHALQLSPHCDSIVQEGSSNQPGGDDCGDLPVDCTRHNAVYHILHYLTDAQFLVDGNQHLRYVALFLPVARSTALLPYYYSISQLALMDNVTRVVAMDFGLKEALFNDYMVRDVLFLSAGAAIVFLLMWWYTASIFLTSMAILSIVLSLSVAYFIYTFVFELDFFPFMNLLAAVIVVGIGADDVFVYVQVWRCTKLDKEGSTLAKLVNDTLAHAGLSMLVTSLTTAAAFFSSFVCPVTAIRCFSLFAGLTVTVHFLFMLSWLPASVLLSEKYCSPVCQSHAYKLPGSCSKRIKRCLESASDVARIIFDKILPCIVVKLRYFWIVLLGSLAIAAGVAVFYYPQLKLPDTREFQLFSSNHFFERYDMEFKEEFWFERSQRTELLAKLPLRFVWGVQAEDNGNYLDPTSKGSLILDPAFNMAAPESQLWLARFCQNIRNEPFFQPTLGPLLPNCFIETFQSWMDRRCEDAMDKQNRTPCCEVSRFPYEEEVFNQCILLAVKDLYETPSAFFMPGLAGPRFSTDTHTIEAVVVEFDSNISYSLSYTEMHQFYQQVESWMQGQLASAPQSMRSGWFTSDLSFYDVQHSLSESTVSAIALAMAIALMVLVCATGNLWLSFISTICLSSVVLVSIAVLVLLGWKLNILESVSVSIAVGLSVDFTLHYAVGYRLSGDDADRESAVVYSLSRMSSPIAMAAFTTLSAGAAVLPSSVLAYQQIGTFVVVVMITSWLYATLFLPSMLRICGPQRGFSQIRIPCKCPSWVFCCCRRMMTSPSHHQHIDKTVYSHGLSESTMSTSSACHNPNANQTTQSSLGEAHELEPLTTSHRNKAIKNNRPRSGSLVATCKEHHTSKDTRTGATGDTEMISKMRKISLPSTALLTAENHEPRVVCIETHNSDMWTA